MDPASGANPSPEEMARRVAWFHGYVARMASQPADLPLRCPCCGCLTLDERGDLSLTQARDNYRRFGACDEVSIKHVRPPRPDERPGQEPA